MAAVVLECSSSIVPVAAGNMAGRSVGFAVHGQWPAGQHQPAACLVEWPELRPGTFLHRLVNEVHLLHSPITYVKCSVVVVEQIHAAMLQGGGCALTTAGPFDGTAASATDSGGTMICKGGRHTSVRLQMTATAAVAEDPHQPSAGTTVPPAAQLAQPAVADPAIVAGGPGTRRGSESAASLAATDASCGNLAATAPHPLSLASSRASAAQRYRGALHHTAVLRSMACT